MSFYSRDLESYEARFGHRCSDNCSAYCAKCLKAVCSENADESSFIAEPGFDPERVCSDCAQTFGPVEADLAQTAEEYASIYQGILPLTEIRLIKLAYMKGYCDRTFQDVTRRVRELNLKVRG